VGGINVGLSKDMKRKGPQTTPAGTKIYREHGVGVIRPDGTWSGRHWRGGLVIVKQGQVKTREERAADKKAVEEAGQ
jgi:hypothetical protein